jgi:hypothetical protein
MWIRRKDCDHGNGEGGTEDYEGVEVQGCAAMLSNGVRGRMSGRGSDLREIPGDDPLSLV